jgi:hypothetical protein
MTTHDIPEIPDEVSGFLRTASEEIGSRLGSLTRTIRPHLGLELTHTNDPHVRQLHDNGAHFNWLAFSFDRIPMWDLHVGLVIGGPEEVHVGVHVLDEADEPVRAVAHTVGSAWSTRRFSESVHEYQYNRAYVITRSADNADIWAAAASLCRSLNTELHAGEPTIGQREDAQ